MKLYLAGEGFPYLFSNNAEQVNRLKSFYYSTKKNNEAEQPYKSFMLDSGAFTFAYGSGADISWEKYLDQYISYIAENDVQLFFELDIDKLVGFKKVLEYRKYLEDSTKKKCIPVWHMNRGRKNWQETCEEYEYVALGGLAAKEFSNQEKVIPWFTKTAHRLDCKVHGLGYTKIKNLPRTGFDSVDSSSWLYGNMGGFVYLYKGNFFMQRKSPPPGKRLNTKRAAEHNFMEWIRLSRELEKL